MPKKFTRGPQGGGSIRKRPNGTWEARYTVGRDPGTGKQVQKSVYGKTQAEVRKKLQSVCTAIDEGLYIEPSRLTIADWLDIWLKEYAAQSIKPLTMRTYKTQCDFHIKPALGAVKLCALNTNSIQSFYNKMQEDSVDSPELSAKTIKNIHGVLHKALSKAVQLHYIPYNPADACALPRVDKKEIKPLEEADIAAFLRALQGEAYQSVFLVTLFTGMRESEVLGLTWDKIDFNEETITIDRQLQKRKNGEYYLISPKSNKGRKIAPAHFVLQVLKNERRHQNENKLKAGSVWNNPLNLVFSDEMGKNLVQRTVVKHYKKIVTSIGIPEARFHDLRHTYAVTALQKGDDIKTVQENLEHHAAAFTLDVYGHVTEQMKRDSAQRMDEFIKGIQSCKG